MRSRRSSQRSAQRVALLVAVFCLLATSSSARAQEANALWTEATTYAGAGDDALAVATLATLTESFPDDPLTDDALFLAGNLLEEKLGKPEEARDQYQALLARFPDSRTALAAQRRLERLNESLGETGEGAEVTVQFQDILRGYPNRELSESLRLAKALAEANADWPGVHRIHLWLAAATRRKGDLEEAASHYSRVVESDAPAAAQVQAMLGLVEVAILRDDHGRAEELLVALEKRNALTISDQHSVAELWVLLGSSRQRMRLLWVGGFSFILAQLAFLVLLRRQIGSWMAAGKALLKPTTEFYYMLPGACLLTIMAMTGHKEIGPAVAIICAGGLVTTALASTWLRLCRPLKPSQAWFAASASLLATVSVCYLALQRSQLLDLVATTVRFGPE